MTVAIVLDVPGVTEAPIVVAQGILATPLQLGNLLQVVPPSEPRAVRLNVGVADDDCTWEDAEWQ
jgi:hypothetical protein